MHVHINNIQTDILQISTSYFTHPQPKSLLETPPSFFAFLKENEILCGFRIFIHIEV